LAVKKQSCCTKHDRMIFNALSFDIEDYFHGEAFQLIDSPVCQNWQQRVLPNTHMILNELRRHHMKATFFVLGVVAEEYPELIREIHSQGHEIASHGYSHTPLYRYKSSSEVSDDITHSKRVIEAVIQEPVLGYRAPSFSIRKDTLWSLDIVRSAGFQYDSSIYPIHHDRYGIPDSPTKPHEIIEGLTELPPATCTIFKNVRIPFGGGGYFRLFPHHITTLFTHLNNYRSQPNIFYFHPHDFDEAQPLDNLGILSRLRRKVGLKNNKKKFIKFLSNHQFVSIRQMLSEYERSIEVILKCQIQ
jgi:polysaccharide deacetylase family protein (PEP-CTERM system associated)